jgi:pimeloyl-ACP methyl ester carboxylesterase
VLTREEFIAICARIACPVLVLHGTEDGVRPFANGEELAERTGGTVVALEATSPSSRAG